MKTQNSSRNFLLCCFAALSLSGCLNGKWFDEKSELLADRTAKVGDSLAAGLMLRLTDRFNDTLAPSLKFHVADLLQKALDAADAKLDSLDLKLDGLDDKAAKVRDSLFNEELKALLKDLGPVHLFGDRTKARVEDLTDLLKGVLPKKDYLAAMLDQASLQALDDSVRLQLLVASLLGSEFEGRSLRLVDSVLVRVNNSVKTTKVEAEGFLDKVKKYAVQILIGLGVLLLGAGAFFARRFRRNKKLLETLTFNIHNLADQDAYDALTDKIQYDAKKNHVEPLLRNILKKQGLLDNWKPASKRG